MSALSTVYVMVDIVKWGGRLHTPPPPLSPAWAELILMMECTPESGHCNAMHYVYSVVETLHLDCVLRGEFKSEKLVS